MQARKHRHKISPTGFTTMTQCLRKMQKTDVHHEHEHEHKDKELQDDGEHN